MSHEYTSGPSDFQSSRRYCPRASVPTCTDMSGSTVRILEDCSGVGTRRIHLLLVPPENVSRTEPTPEPAHTLSFRSYLLAQKQRELAQKQVKKFRPPRHSADIELDGLPM